MNRISWNSNSCLWKVSINCKKRWLQ